MKKLIVYLICLSLLLAPVTAYAGVKTPVNGDQAKVTGEKGKNKGKHKKKHHKKHKKNKKNKNNNKNNKD